MKLYNVFYQEWNMFFSDLLDKNSLSVGNNETEAIDRVKQYVAAKDARNFSAAEVKDVLGYPIKLEDEKEIKKEDKISVLNVKPIYISNEEDLKYANEGAKIGDVKTWEFEIGLPNNLMCHYRICSLEFDSSPRFYCENNNIYNFETKELHSHINVQKVNREDIHNAMADYIVNNPKVFGSLYEWALAYNRTYECLKTNIELSGFTKEQYIKIPSGKEVYFDLCTYADEIKSFDDIDYYLTHDNNFNSSESLSFLAANAVNIDAIEKQNQKSKENLITYYQEKNIADLLETPYELLTEEDHDTLSFFSDWHKDLFGYRPRGLNNAVQNYLNSQIENDEIELD